MAERRKTSSQLSLKPIRQWYIGQGESWVGPYTDDEVMRRLQDGLVSWVDFVWSPTQGLRWCRISDVIAFQSYMPKSPSDDLIREIRSTLESKPAGGKTSSKTAPPDSSLTRRKSIWFLQFEGSEFGPLTLAEVQVILKSGKLKGRLFGWREGMPNWMSVDQITELHGVSEDLGVAGRSSSDERRRSKRVPLVATVRFNVPGDTSAGVTKYMGVCRDISAQGLLILSNRVPFENSGPIRMEVSPLGSSGVEPFNADVEVIRILPDKKGFSVRFQKMSDTARQAIEKYLSRN